MKRAELLEQLNIARPCLSAQDIVPILAHFCFTDEEIIAFNGTQGIIVDYETDLGCGLPGELLIKLLGSYSAAELKISQKGDEINIKAGKSTAKLASLPESEFIFDMPDLDEATSFTASSDFLTGISKCLISVSKNSLKRNQFGITLDSSKKGTHLYSTDNQRISRYTLEKSLGKKVPKVLLPEVFCQLLVDVSRNLGDTEPDIYLGDDFVYAAFEGVYVYSKLLMGIEYLPFEDIIAGNLDEEDIEFQDIPDELVTAIERTALLTSKETDQVVHLTADEDALQVFGNSGYGEVKESISFDEEITEDGLSCRMDPTFLLTALQSVEDMALLQSTGEEPTPIFVGTSGNFFHLLMGFRED